MRVYAFYDSSPSAHPEQAEFLRLWALSWERRGFTPKLLTARHAARSKFFPGFTNDPDYLKWFALHAVRGSGWLVSSRVINFSLFPKRLLSKKKLMDVNAFSWPAIRVSRASVKQVVSSMKQVTKTEPFPAGLEEFSCAADALNSGRLV